MHRAESLFKRENFEEARKMYEDTLKEDGAHEVSGPIHYKLGVIQFVHGNIRDASIEQFQQGTIFPPYSPLKFDCYLFNFNDWFSLTLLEAERIATATGDKETAILACNLLLFLLVLSVFK